MLDDEKIIDICDKLLLKSRANEVEWISHGSWQKAEGQNYWVSLDTSKIAIGFGSPPSDPDFYAFTFYAGDRIITHKVVRDPDNPLWTHLADLYHDADRCVRKWDVALDELQNALDSEGKIGKPEGIEEDDIPF